MIWNLVFAVGLLTQEPQVAPEKPNASEVVGKMLNTYFKAKSLKGTILLNFVAGQEKGQLRTLVQYQEPNLVFIRQESMVQDPRGLWKPTSFTQVVSNGKVFTYPVPEGQLGSATHKLLAEPAELDGVIVSHREIYGIAGQSLKERSAPLDIAFGRYADLKYLKNQWATMEYKGEIDYQGQKVHVIEGNWRSKGGAVVENRYQMLISEDFQLKQYKLSGTHVFVNDAGQSTPPMLITQTWTVDLEVNVPTDPSMFVLG